MSWFAQNGVLGVTSVEAIAQEAARSQHFNLPECAMCELWRQNDAETINYYQYEVFGMQVWVLPSRPARTQFFQVQGRAAGATAFESCAIRTDASTARVNQYNEFASPASLPERLVLPAPALNFQVGTPAGRTARMRSRETHPF